MRFMLAERGTPADLDRLSAGGYVFDLKIDGIRALVTVEPPGVDERTDGAGSASAVAMTSRNGLDLTGRYPELVAAVQQLAAQRSGVPAGGRLVLDAEIAVPGPDGLPSWPLTHRRTAQRSAGPQLARQLPARLYVFDLLTLDGEDTTGWLFARRRAALEELSTTWPQQVTLTPLSADVGPLWEMVVEQGLEGVIAKKHESRYRPGRSRDWVKIKATQTLSCLVGGVEWAPEAPTEPRSLQLFLVDPAGELVPVGKASAGVSAALRPALLHGLSHPPLIVEVEYSQVTPVGVLRHPVVRAVRTDIDVLHCSTDQLSRSAAP